MNFGKKTISALLVAVIFAAGLPGVIAEDTAENLLGNGGFENAALTESDWHFAGTEKNWYITGGGERTTAQKNNGSYSVKLNQATAGQRVALTAGTTYILTASVRADSATSSPDMGFYDGANEWPSSNAIETIDISATTEWKEVTLEFTCGTSQDYVICLMTWDDSVNVYFDDVTLTASEPAGTGTGIINGSFSNGAEGWTISDESAASVTDGVLTASGTVRVSQTVKGLENGTYNFIAYAANSDIQETGISYFYAKSPGHVMASTSIPENSGLQKIIVPNVTVEDGTCDIGLYLNGSAAVTLDNISFEKTESTRLPFYKGGEISKLTYLEDKNTKFYRADGTQADALQIMAENGFNMARIRLLDDPGKGHGDGTYYLPAGYMDEADCLELARRAKDKGMAIEFTIAYSDYWVDGEKQYMPHKWQEEIDEKGITATADIVSYLENKVYEYTKDILEKLIEQGTCPEYISIGNEMQCGILFGHWSDKSALYYNETYQTRFLKAGAKAVREISPESKIVLHSHNGGLVSKETLFMKFVKNVDFDVIGVSYYPYYNANVSIDTVVSEFNSFINTYNKDVLIMETGYNWNQYKYGGNWEGQLQDSGYYQNIYGESKEGQRAFLTELYSKLKQVAGGRCIGDLYWDPIMVNQSGVGWAEKESNDKTDSEVVSNSTIFDFSHKAVPGQLAMKYNTDSNDKLNITGKITSSGKAAANKEVSFTVNGSQYNVTTDKFGEYIVSVPYPSSEKLSIALKGSGTAYNDVDAVYDGVLMSGFDFGDFDTNTDPDPTPTTTPEPTASPTAPPTAIPTAPPTAPPTSIPTTDPNKVYISDIEAEMENGTISYDVQYSAGEKNAIFFVALYDEDGILIGCRIDESSSSFENVPNTSKYIVKAFLWEAVYSSPLCDYKEKKIG